MTKQDGEYFKGKIVEVLPSCEYRVQLHDNQRIILARSSGKIRKHRIKILLCDEVVVRMQLNYDPNRGLITERHNPGGKRFSRSFKR